MKVTKEQIRKIILEVDEDMSGEIEFDEFMTIMHKELYTKKRQVSVWSDDIYTEEEREKAGPKGTGARDSSKPKKGTPQPSGKAVGDKKADEEPENLMPLDFVAAAYRRKKVRHPVLSAAMVSSMGSSLLSPAADGDDVGHSPVHIVKT